LIPFSIIRVPPGLEFGGFGTLLEKKAYWKKKGLGKLFLLAKFKRKEGSKKKP